MSDIELTTSERLVTVEQQTKHILDNVSELKCSIKEIKGSINGLNESLSHKFAAKWVERAAVWLVMLILASVFTALLTLVILPTK